MKFGRLWTTVIVTQVAITTLFLAAVVSVGWTTFQSAQDADVTFAREQILTARLVVEAGAHPEARNFQSSYRALADRLRREPGIGGVTYATEMPGTTFGRSPLEFAQPDVASGAVPHEDGLWVRSSRVGPSYFETLAVPLVAGRVFTEAEIAANSPVAVVDETFVRLILGGRSAVGLMVREPATAPGDQPGPWFEIVGVVADVTVRPRKRSYDSMLYRPAAIDLASTVHVMARIPGPASSMPLAHTLPAAAASATSDLRLEQPKSLDRVAADEALPNRILARVLTVVAAVALLLSTAGIYALVAFTLARRTREIGIRIALGAAPRRIITGTFSRAFMQVALGVALGAMPGVILVLEADDRGGMTGPGLTVTLGVGAFVIAVALMSCAAPLRRALRIEPMQALRADS